ncbi:MAG: zinc-ribbon domain-containing protein [Candidatus Hodarchaeota archaeon]
MFCPHCGEKLKDPDQKFCQNCGSELSTPAGDSQLITEIESVPSKIESPSIPKTIEAPVSDKQILTPGTPGRFSKKCLAFAIVSICIAIPFLIIGFNIFRYSGQLFVFSLNEMARRFPALIALIVIHFIGSFFAGKSKSYGKMAKEFEPVNTSEKVGSSLRIVGEIINDIPIGVYFTILIVNLILIYF